MARLGTKQLLILLSLLGGAAIALRLANLRRMAKTIGDRIPTGAMSIRRDSLVDLTVDGRPVRQTVFVAESTDGQGESEVISSEIEELDEDADPNDSSDDPSDASHEHDPSDKNVTNTVTELLPEPEPEPASGDTDDLYAEAEAVLAEASIEEATDEEIAEALAAEVGVDSDDSKSIDDEDSEREDSDNEDSDREDPSDQNEPQNKNEPQDGSAQFPRSVKPGADGQCPPTHPIKARYATGRYHEPGSGSYENVIADVCYRNADDAEADGFSRSPL